MQSRIAKGFILLGIVMLGAAAWTAYRQHTIFRHWPTVEAEVVDSRVTQGTDSDGAMMYRAAIEFRYSVDGKDYSTPAASNISTSDYASVKRQVDKYSQGTRHRIWHNPVNPDEVYFDAGYNISFFFLPVLLGGMGIVSAGVGLAVVAVQRSSDSNA